MTKEQFEQKLRSLSYGDLISLLLKTSNAVQDEILSLFPVNPPCQKSFKIFRFLAKYIAKLEKSFATAPAPLSIDKVEMVLQDLKDAGGTKRDIAFCRLSYAPCCVDELISFCGGPGLYEEAEENFKAALEYARENRVFFSENMGLFCNVANNFPKPESLQNLLVEI